MLNVIIPINDNFDKYRKMFDFFKDAYDIKLLVGMSSQYYQVAVAEYSEVANFTFFEFDENTDKEEIINALQGYTQQGQIMILRKPITEKEFDKIIKADRDVVTAKVVRSKFKSFMFNLWQKITKLLLGVKMYAGDTSVVYFNYDIAEVVANSTNLSYSSRVNRWKGIKQAVVTCEENTDKKRIDVAFNAKRIIAASCLVAVAAVATTLIFLFVPMTVLIAMLMIALDGVCLSIAFILIVILVFTNMTGKKHQKKAIILSDNRKDREDV